MLRQGDLLIVKINDIPKGIKKVPSGIVFRGEATGHAHRLVGGDVFSDNGVMFLDVEKTAKLLHEEHKPLILGKGKWSVIRQREYQSKDMTRLVVD